MLAAMKTLTLCLAFFPPKHLSLLKANVTNHPMPKREQTDERFDESRFWCLIRKQNIVIFFQNILGNWKI